MAARRSDWEQAAEHFINREKEFHLGALPTEQSHPATRDLARVTAVDTRRGIAQLLAVDQDIIPAARRVLTGAEYHRLVKAMADALGRGGRICFSGCGATGRLSILLEAAYRAFRRDTGTGSPDAVVSLMTGGDYALVRSVESFEDYETFGRRQVEEAGIGQNDVLVAVSEGGETSSVIGTVWQALEHGARVFFACNNPTSVLAAHVERSRRVIEDPRVVKLDLSSGPMAVAGSTRMQATTCELLVLGTALEEALGLTRSTPGVCIRRFANILRDLQAPEALDALAGWVELEEAVYRGGNAVTYFGGDFLLDIFTDTTERAPTFSLPPFRKRRDTASPRPLAFAKNPLHSTAGTWRAMLGREPRCLDWSAAVYRKMGAAEKIWRSPPVLNRTELFQFTTGREDDPSRRSSPGDCAVLVLVGRECGADPAGRALRDAFVRESRRFPARALLSVGERRPSPRFAGPHYHVPCRPAPSALRLWEHLALKLILNTISTAAAVRLGRVEGNWMACVEATNKKLIDRGTRLVAELAGLDYGAACRELHRSRSILARTRNPALHGQSPVAFTLARLRKPTRRASH